VKKLVVLLVSLTAALASAQEEDPPPGQDPAQKRAAVQQLLKVIKTEPTVKDCQRWALKYYKLEPGRILEWANDGRALFIEETHDARGLASHILRRDLGTGRRELWREERPGDQAGLSSVRCVISGDGRSYACSQTRMLSSLFLVEGLK